MFDLLKSIMEYSFDDCLLEIYHGKVDVLRGRKIMSNKYFDEIVCLAIQNKNFAIFRKIFKIYDFILPSESFGICWIIKQCIVGDCLEYAKYILRNIRLDIGSMVSIITLMCEHGIDPSSTIHQITNIHSYSYIDKKDIGYQLLSIFDYIPDNVIEIFLGHNYRLDKYFMCEFGIPVSSEHRSIKRILDHGLDKYIDEIFDEIVVIGEEDTLEYFIEIYKVNLKTERSIVTLMNKMVQSPEDIPKFIIIVKKLKEHGFGFYLDPSEADNDAIKAYIGLINLLA